MIKYFLVVVILILFLIKFKNNEGYMECPESYHKKIEDIQKNYVDQLRAYTPNDYIYITENISDNLPIPVNIGFLDNKF
jgi:hypothetical protein